MAPNMLVAEDKEDTAEEEAEVKQTGFVRDRRCTDIVCIIIWALHVIVFLVVTFMGFANGNPSKLYSPRDYQGAYCGVETNWNSGPNLANHQKLGFMMNVSKTTDLIAKQLMCSTSAKNYLLSAAAGLTTQQQQDYMCACCLSPCSTCDGSLSVGGDIVGDLTSGNPFSTISDRMADLTNLANARSLASPSSLNGDLFTNIWSQATQYLVQVCLPACQNDVSILNASYRQYLYTPSPDEVLSTAWSVLMSAPTAAGWNGSFTFNAFPESICPYPAAMCVPFPGLNFVEVSSSGYCMFTMAADVVAAVGSTAASIMETSGADAFAGSVSETFGLWIGDLRRSLDTFVIVCVICFAVGLIYLVLLRFTVKFCVWFAVFAIFAGLALGGAFAWVRSFQCAGTGIFDTAQQVSVSVAIAGSTAVTNAVTGTTQVSESCDAAIMCADYRGVQTRTQSGKLCQNWDATSPHNHSATVSSAIYPDHGLTTAVSATSNVSNNYCRNPYRASDLNKASSIYCFTTDATKRWELCSPIGVIQPACQNGYAVSGETARKVLEICGYVIWGLCAVWLILVFCLVNRIRLAIALNEVAAKFLSNTPTVLLVPIVQAITGCIWVLVWMLCASFLLSQVPDSYTPTAGYRTYAEAYGTEDTPGPCTDKWPTGFVWKDAPQNCGADGHCWKCAPPRYIIDVRLWISFASFLWNNEFLIAIGQFIIAGSVGVWFFTPNSDKGKLKGGQALMTANWNMWRYHSGSLALGSFILMLVQLIRYLMKYFEKQAEAQKNRIVALILRVLQCCIYCFERFLRFLNKNAYIQVAIRGTGFCTSAKKAFQIIMQNVLRFGTIAILGYVVHAIGYVFIMAATLVCGYFILRGMHSDISPVIPLIIYGFMSYIVGNLYMNVFGLAVDTSLQCVIFAEEKCPDGDFVPSELRSVMDRSKARKDLDDD